MAPVATVSTAASAQKAPRCRRFDDGARKSALYEFAQDRLKPDLLVIRVLIQCADIQQRTHLFADYGPFQPAFLWILERREREEKGSRCCHRGIVCLFHTYPATSPIRAATLQVVQARARRHSLQELHRLNLGATTDGSHDDFLAAVATMAMQVQQQHDLGNIGYTSLEHSTGSNSIVYNRDGG
uniref:Uncharacterized protein n=1 Tax=Oryza meridionalis TaxID=40149 RepID=A0A0E0EME3_9ORYZ